MLTPAAWEAIHAWATARLGAPADTLRGVGVHAQAHGAAFADYHGVYVWAMGQAAIVSAPAAWLARVESAALRQAPAALTEPAFWRAALGEASIERIVGPSYQGFVDADAFHPVDARDVHPLIPADEADLRAFIAACPPDDWDDSAIAPDHDTIFGLRRAGTLVALASAPRDALGMRSVGVVTLPAWRGQGCGRAVVSALTARWLANGSPVLHYQTLRANLGSVAVARALGYADAASALAIRLR
ncbi:MAG: hypothetical protein KGO05_15455 [Chloroflexota bacterium]|nr:hypothetical protein [Chloroflexota bacterium]